jgi:hypothetical protein
VNSRLARDPDGRLIVEVTTSGPELQPGQRFRVLGVVSAVPPGRVGELVTLVVREE